jgi:hypothetical protein
MTELEELYAARIDKIRNAWEIDMTGMDDTGVPDGVVFMRDGLAIALLPTTAEGMLMIDVSCFRDGARVHTDTIMLRNDP